jgi:hypothetical protein
MVYILSIYIRKLLTQENPLGLQRVGLVEYICFLSFYTLLPLFHLQFHLNLPGPSPGSLDLAQVALSPGQSPEVRAGTVWAAQAATFQPRRRPQPQGHQCRRRQQPQSSLVVAEAILVALHQHFKAGPDLQPAHQTVSHNILTCFFKGH